MGKEIRLTQGKVTVVDDADFDWLNQWRWYAGKSGSTYYAVRPKQQRNKRSLIFMHREILKPPENRETDHKDGNGLNNQRYNLRVATHTQNQCNARKRKGTTSRFKGVYWDRLRSKWRAQIKIGGKEFHLGRFLSETEAAQSYNIAAKKYFGEFARTNFQTPGHVGQDAIRAAPKEQ